MMPMLRKISSYIDRCLEIIGKAIALLVFVIIGTIIFEMLARGLFDMPTSWTHELSAWLLAAFILIGGPWALAKGQFVRVDVFHGQMSPKMKAIVDSFISTVLFILFAWVLIWLGGKYAFSSFQIGERSATGGWGGPVWLAKSAVPIGAVLLSFGWIAHILKLWADVIDPETEGTENG